MYRKTAKQVLGEAVDQLSVAVLACEVGRYTQAEGACSKAASRLLEVPRMTDWSLLDTSALEEVRSELTRISNDVRKARSKPQ